MIESVRRLRIGLLTISLGCGFDASGGAGGPMLGGGLEGGGTQAADDETSAGSDSTQGSGGDDGSEAPGSSETGESEPDSGPSAELEISGAPLVDFGLVTIGTPKVLLLDVENVGAVEAVGMKAEALGPPFSFADGAYPGTGGTCGDVLDPGQTCSVSVRLVPMLPVSSETQIRIEYDGGSGPKETLRALRGGGRSENLVGNPGAETASLPPWAVASGSWSASCWNMTPKSGQRCFYSGAGSTTAGQSTLWQDVQLDASWAAAIDAGEIALAFEGWGRSALSEAFRFRVRFRSANDHLQTLLQTDYQYAFQWAQVHGVATAPPGTRVVRISLDCWKASGYYCDTYFDDLELLALPAE
jgi:hypothetical protein